MPTYEYKCKDCEVYIEEEHPMGEAPKTAECPDCNKQVERYYGSMSFILKGNDWPGKIIKRSKGVGSGGGKRGGATMNEVIDDRKKKGLDTMMKEKPMSDAEFKRRKDLNMRWLEQTKD